MPKKIAQFPTDENRNVIPLLRLRPTGAHKINAAAASARNTVPFTEGVRAISFTVRKPIYLEFGDGTVTASVTTHCLEPGYYTQAIAGADGETQFTHMAVRRVTEDSVVDISELF